MPRLTSGPLPIGTRLRVELHNPTRLARLEVVTAPDAEGYQVCHVRWTDDPNEFPIPTRIPVDVLREEYREEIDAEYRRGDP